MKTHIQNLFLALALLAGIHESTAQAQNLFVTDPGTGCIYEFTPGGVQSTFASGLNQPAGLAFDSAGNLFVACSGDGNIYKYTTNGVKSTFSSGFLLYPGGMAFDSAGNLFVADSSTHVAIYEFTNNAGILSSNAFTYASSLDGPFGLAFNSSGNLFETDTGMGNINKFTTIGLIGARSVFANIFLFQPTGLAFDSTGNLFVSDVYSNNIYKYTTNGTQSIFVSSGLHNPYALAFDTTGNLFEADEGSGSIYKFTNNVGTLSSTFVTFATGLTHPSYLAFGTTATPQSVPSVSIATVANQSVLFWSASSTNYILQSATNLSSPNWTTVSNGTSIIGVTVTNTLPAQFFRIQPQ